MDHGGPPVVARGYDERRDRDSYEASSRRYERSYRGAPVYRGLEEFGASRYREPAPRVYWDSAPSRRVYREDGWRRY